MASAFFGKGQFVADEYQVEKGKITMTSELEAPYYQPFPKERLLGDGVWEKMPKNERPQSEIQKLRTTIVVSEIEKGFELDIRVEGTERVPLAIELIFRPGGEFENISTHEVIKDAYFLKEVSGKYFLNGEYIEFGPALHEHKWIAIRGALPKMDAPSVYLTGFTPCNHKLRIS